MNVYFSVGANVGNRERYIKNAISSLKTLGEIECSSLYETTPWGNLGQENFLNAVCVIETDKKPAEILLIIKSIEKGLGRKRITKWGPRTIDIDILFYGDVVIHTADLIIPHPHISGRKFVLVPLNEIASNLVHPVLKKTVEQMLRECKDKGEVKLWQSGDLLLLKA